MLNLSGNMFTILFHISSLILTFYSEFQMAITPQPFKTGYTYELL